LKAFLENLANEENDDISQKIGHIFKNNLYLKQVKTGDDNEIDLLIKTIPTFKKNI
jgi:hypothetical protein